jgi:thiamine-monophosphate kinase
MTSDWDYLGAIMTIETAFIDALRTFCDSDAARGLNDDVAMLGDLVISHDMIVEGVHFLPDDPPEDVAWKLAAVNLSDLAAKGAVPVAAIMGAGLGRDAGWNEGFAKGMGQACATFGLPLIGGDTVVMPGNAPITLGMTIIGQVHMGKPQGRVPHRGGALAGDAVYVAGVIGDAGLGLRLLKAGHRLGQNQEYDPLIAAYRRPVPMLETGRALAPIVNAMMDVSDGLLIDAQRLAVASGMGMSIDLDAVPLSKSALNYLADQGEGDQRRMRLNAATAGDDYALLFTATRPLPPAPGKITRIGTIQREVGLRVTDSQGEVPLPDALGWVHG